MRYLKLSPPPVDDPDGRHDPDDGPGTRDTIPFPAAHRSRLARAWAPEGPFPLPVTGREGADAGAPGDSIAFAERALAHADTRLDNLRDLVDRFGLDPISPGRGGPRAA